MSLIGLRHPMKEQSQMGKSILLDLSRRRALAAMTTSLIAGCSGSRFFRLHWDEEVLVAPGSTVVVSLQYVYENLGGLFEGRYERAILRQTDISFNAGESIGRFSKSFDHHHVDLIVLVENTW